MSESLCSNCKHFYITHKRNFPYGCRAFGVISKKFLIWKFCQFLAQIVHYFQKRIKMLM